ncbi:uncharacterized protein EI97DRAFT_199204 [Westerdykella ornata]|uniref:C2H2-type domain-containing protein n=1 Tax=Westerdykella ornata TaxID=318751 RepID=A0A6A6J9R8_WESOR|nr:uncharacterized protein EI97DRAFT_199204 [Westerdykella ornata]KAF2272728.1 hypothetical protein EI97DRAFT_199204 [Westerdykella ornata]
MDDYMEEEQFLPMTLGEGNAMMQLDDSSAYLHDNFQHLRPGLEALQEDSYGTEYPSDTTPSWQNTTIASQNYGQFHGLTGTSARSSVSSGHRLSNTSIFSQPQWRGSVASTSTTWSDVSQSRSGLNTTALTGAPLRSTQPSTSRHRNRRPTASTPRYWCTSCHEPFGEKYDWKRHEETYQERSVTYHCGLCPKTYFLDKDFIHHHRERHRCQTCVENKHAEVARRQRRTRTGWGCGFCLRWDGDWGERCKHVAWHFEKNGDGMHRWNQTQVILSLLQQPGVRREWHALLERKGEANPSFGWSRSWAGRAEGYLEGECEPQLQDVLEFYTPDQDARALVEWAWELGHQPPGVASTAKGRNKGSASRCSSSPDKALPSLPTSQPPPPVPPKDQALEPAITHMTTDLPIDLEHWEFLIDSIPDDSLLPHGIPMDFSNLDPAHFDLHVDTSMHFQ